MPLGLLRFIITDYLCQSHAFSDAPTTSDKVPVYHLEVVKTLINELLQKIKIRGYRAVLTVVINTHL